MAFWSGEKILAFATANPTFLTNFDAKRIDCNAYTLNMGNEYFVTADASDPQRRHNHRQILEDNASFVIPPGQFAFLLTADRIEIPDHAMAFISMKATYKFQGLINVSGFHVDPGYKGHLVFSVYNAGPAPVHLRDKLPLFLIWFADLDKPSKQVRKDSLEKTLSNDLLKGMSGEILSLQSLSEQIASVKFETRLQSWFVGIAGAVFFAIVIATANYVIQHGAQAFTAPAAPSTSGAAPAAPPTRIIAPAPAAPPPAAHPAPAQQGQAGPPK